ncbi:hypothetical protein NYK91_000531 [Enterococcus hirae]|nr:hypothetical protein [Enterococcus hirae]
MGQRNTFSTIFMLVMVFIIGSFVISLFTSILWFAIKLLIPIAIIIWLIRVISGTNRRLIENITNIEKSSTRQIPQSCAAFFVIFLSVVPNDISFDGITLKLHLVPS